MKFNLSTKYIILRFYERKHYSSPPLIAVKLRQTLEKLHVKRNERL